MRKIIAIIILSLFFALQVNAQDIVIYLPVIMKMTTDNNWRIVQPVASSNLILNPSAETTGNFSVVSGAIVTRRAYC